MKWLRKLWSKLAGAVQARYEGAIWRWGERSWIPASIQDARFDADSSTRLELIRKSRYFERNSALVNALADVFEQFTVGTGLQCIPASSSEGWNAKAAEAWGLWCQYPDLTSLQGFGTLQGLIARSWFIDGEVFIRKTKSPDTGRNRVELIEAHRIQTPPSRRSEEGRTIVDGIEINEFGRPVAYWVKTSPVVGVSAPAQVQQVGIDEQWARIPAEEMLHVMEPGRPGQYHGLPFLYPVMNDLHDLEDLQIYEMQAAKDAATNSTFVTNAAGEAPSSTAKRRLRLQIQSQDASGNAVVKEAAQWYEDARASGIRYLRPGEDVKQFVSGRPSVAVQQYWDYLIQKVCAGVGIPKLLVMPWGSIQGTVVRGVYDSAAIFFRCRSQVIQDITRDLYAWVMRAETAYNRKVSDKPGDWYKVNVCPPRAVNVDVGYQSAANIADLQAGILTHEELIARSGQDWRVVLENKARIAAHVKALAEKYGVTPQEIISYGKSDTTADAGGAEEEEEPSKEPEEEPSED